MKAVTMDKQSSNTVLIAGGYGVVGKQIAEIIRARHPSVELLLGGRNPGSAEHWVSQLGNAKAVTLDVESASPLDNLAVQPDVVMSVVNDPHNRLLDDSIRRGCAYVDIARWTQRMRDAIVAVSMQDLKAPVMFSSAWMAGVAVLLARAASDSFASVDSVDLSILFAMADKAGPNSAEYMDRMAIPFELMVNGNTEQRMPFSDPKTVKFPGGYCGKVYRFDVPDQMTLPGILGAQSVSGRIGFDSAAATGSLAFMVNSGLMKLLSRPLFDGVRRGLLYNPGEGAAHELVIDLVGKAADGTPLEKRVSVLDPKGQTHLTACGAVIQLERILGLDGAAPPVVGIHFPEKNANLDAALKLLRDHDVEIKGIEIEGVKIDGL